MKTQEIQLDSADNVESIRDHLAWAHTPRVLLIWPLDGGVHIQPSDLLLLCRYAESLGQELGIVTRDRDFQTAARKLNISVFLRVRDAQDKPWEDRRTWRLERRFPRSNLKRLRSEVPPRHVFTVIADPILRWGVLGAGILSILLVTLFLLPTAEIQITPPEKSQDVTIAVSADPDARDVQISGVVPQHQLDLTLSAQESALVTGGVDSPDQKASGSIQITNLTTKAFLLPSGSLVTTSTTPAFEFQTTQDVQIPAGKGKTAQAQVLAVNPGIAGNLPVGSLTSLPGDLTGLVSVTNPSPLGGGTQNNVLMPTDEDRASLKKRILSELQQRALQRFRAMAGPGDVLFLDTITMNRVTAEAYTPPVGQPGEKLTLSLTVDFQMTYASGAELHDLAEQVLDASLPDSYSPVVKQITIKSLPNFSRVRNIVQWQMQAGRKVHVNINPDQVIQLTGGRLVFDAQKLLTEKLSLSESPVISVHPGWWPWLPFLPIQITVRG